MLQTLRLRNLSQLTTMSSPNTHETHKPRPPSHPQPQPVPPHFFLFGRSRRLSLALREGICLFPRTLRVRLNPLITGFCDMGFPVGKKRAGYRDIEPLSRTADRRYVNTLLAAQTFYNSTQTMEVTDLGLYAELPLFLQAR